VDGLMQDLRYAARTLLKSPGFTLVAVLTLALGIGATTAIFSVVNGVLLKPLPYGAPGSLVVVWESNSRSAVHNVVNPGNFLDWRDRARSFSDMEIFTWSGLTLTGDPPEHVQGLAVSTHLLGLLGVRPLLGRTFVASDADSGGPRTLVLSYGLWARRFGADPGIVGRSVAVAGGVARVVGVMPPGFRPLWHEEYWEPFRLTPAMRQRSGRYTVVVARLKDGVGVAQAQAEMSVITRGLERDYPDFDTGWGASVVPLTEQVVGEARRPLLVLLGAVTMVLLIACANVGNLLLARAASRQREAAVRSALGASRGRLRRLWTVECLLLSSTGAALGVAFASWGVALLRALAPAGAPRLHDVSVDGRVLAFTAGVALLSGLLLALATTRSASGRDPAGALRAAEGRVTSGRAARRFRGGLVAAQVSLALVLLVGAGLLVRSLARLLAVDPGFDASHVATAHIALPDLTYPQPARQVAFWSELLERLSARPGIRAAGVVTFLPLAGPGAATGFTVVGQPAPAPGQGPTTDIRIADPGFFGAMRIPLRRGRLFTTADAAGAPEVAVVNETFARRTWPGEDPIGKRVKVSWAHPDVEVTVVGLVGDVRYQGLDAAVRPTLYYDLAQEPSSEMNVVVRSAETPAALAGEVRSVVHDLDAELPVGEVVTMRQTVAESTLDRRFPMQLLALFAALALLLAVLGIYGVLAYTVRLRTREIGVRLALGAAPGAVVGMIVRSGLPYVLAGVAVGAAGALAASSALRGLLYGIGPGDAATYVAMTLALVAVALLASWLPARRAAKVDPTVALRSE
jgi:putative ABC transport system permease protein